jgi:hypothetical protein
MRLILSVPNDVSPALRKAMQTGDEKRISTHPTFFHHRTWSRSVFSPVSRTSLNFLRGTKKQ